MTFESTWYVLYFGPFSTEKCINISNNSKYSLLCITDLYLLKGVRHNVSLWETRTCTYLNCTTACRQLGHTFLSSYVEILIRFLHRIFLVNIINIFLSLFFFTFADDTHCLFYKYVHIVLIYWFRESILHSTYVWLRSKR